MSAPPEVKSAVLLAATTLETGFEHLSRRKLARLCRDLAKAVLTVSKWAHGE